MNERLSGVDAFVAAVESGNFALAAVRLQLTRSAVAKSVARLEERLGTRLFQRTTRSQSLTEDGHIYYEHCRRALSELDAADSAVEAGRTTPQGLLRVTMPELIGRELIAPVLMELVREHSQLRLEIMFSDGVVDLFEERFDLAVRSGPLGDSAALAARPLGAQWMGVFASPAYLAQHGQPQSMEALIADPEGHRFVDYSRQSSPHPWQFYDAQGRTVRFDTSARSDFTCNSLGANVTAALQGLGLTRLPEWLVEDELNAGTLVRVFAEPQPYGYVLNAIWPKARALPLKTRVAIDRLVERLGRRLAQR